MKTGRRTFLRNSALLAGAFSMGAVQAAAQHEHAMPMPMPKEKALPPPPVAAAPTLAGGRLAVETPDLPRLAWEMDAGVKVFHLVAEPVKQEFLPGSVFDVWGYNGSMPGPTIEVVEGDRVRLIVDNHLPEPTTMHWHGFEIPVEMDGVPGVVQDPIPPGKRFVYEFTVHQNGTFFYHSHMPMQEMMGMMGLFIMHPQQPYQPKVDHDFGLIFQEFALLPNNTIPNTMSMEFNWLTINGKAGPATTPLIVRLGDRVRIRMVNLGMDHHPIHLHGNTFTVTGTEAGRVPESARQPGNTVLLGVAQARDVEFEARYPGDWLLHCHLPHHMMNHMASMVGPLAHVGQGMHTGMGMEEGMGMLRQGSALAEENGPSLGRSLGVAAEFEKPTTNMPLGPGESAALALVPGFPQDMFMAMDEMVAKPETIGLRPTWSGGVTGMMTLVRVLPPELYDRIQALRDQHASPPAGHHQGSGGR